MTSTFDGGCACGALRYRMQSAPMFVHCCHCKDCQRQTGSAFVLNALIETDRVQLLSGDPQPSSMPTDSGKPHRVFRCPQCGTAVWSEYGGVAALRFVRVGTLDEPTALPQTCTSTPDQSSHGSPCRTACPHSRRITALPLCGRPPAWNAARQRWDSRASLTA